MCITGYLARGGGSGGGEPEEQLLERPLNERLIAVIISACSDIGWFFFGHLTPANFSPVFIVPGFVFIMLSVPGKGELLAESLQLPKLI